MIETAEDWNVYLTGCGCCPMPLCPTPSVVCENKTAGIGSEERDHELAVEKWNYERDIWLAEDPDREPGDYPVPYPVDPGITFPIGTSAEYRPSFGSFYSFAPYEQPAGEPEDDIPTLYQILVWGDDVPSSRAKAGVEKKKTIADIGENSSTWSETTYIANTYTHGVTLPSRYAKHVRQYGTVGDPASGACDTDYPSSSYDPFIVWVDVGDDELVCDSTTKTWLTLNQTYTEGTDFSEDSCPGPFSGADLTYADLTRKVTRKTELINPVTKAGLITKVVAEIVWRQWEPGGCIAYIDADWPTIESITWNPCNTDYTQRYTSFGEVNGRKVRFRFRIPDEEHFGSYFKFVYDVLEEPDGWDATIDDPDYVPPVPNDPPEPIPQVPKPDRPLRSFVSEDNVVEWEGPGTPIPDPILDEDEESPTFGEVTNQAAIDAATLTWLTEWNEIDPPEVPGERRLVNVKYSCYHGTLYGVKPQLMGEQVELPDPVPDP